MNNTFLLNEAVLAALNGVNSKFDIISVSIGIGDDTVSVITKFNIDETTPTQFATEAFETFNGNLFTIDPIGVNTIIDVIVREGSDESIEVF